MSTHSLEKKEFGFGQRFHSFMDRSRRSWYSFLAFMTTAIASTAPTFCANATMATIFDKILNIVYDIALYSGLGIVAFGAVSWIMAMKDENAEGQSRAIRFVIVGIALVAAKSLIDPIFNAIAY